jgi:hypothetical protein
MARSVVLTHKGKPAVRVYGRDVWTPVAASPTPRQSWPRRAQVDYVHYTVNDGPRVRSLAAQVQAKRDIWRYHAGTLNWGDIGYSAIFFQPWYFAGVPTCIMARGRLHEPIAQAGANRGNLAVSVYADPNDHIMERTVIGLGVLLKEWQASGVLGHRDQNSTGCPGDKLYARLPDIRRIALA